MILFIIILVLYLAWLAQFLIEQFTAIWKALDKIAEVLKHVRRD